MTAASSPPPRDGEVCAALVAELDTFLGQWRTVGAIPFELAGIVDRFRPAAPSVPPAADSPTPGTETCQARECHGIECLTECSGAHRARVLAASIIGRRQPAAPSPVDTTEPPAETQQDDEIIRAILDRGIPAHAAPFVDFDVIVRELRALAARPSADTETLRRERAAKWIYGKVMRARAGDLIIQIPPWDELTEREQAGWLAEADALRATVDAR